MDTDKRTRQIIVRLLSSMGSAKEIAQYLRRFAQLDAKRFAVVKVGGAVLRDDLEALTSSLAFLQQVGLTPIVVHGAGPQLDDEIAAAGIEKKTIEGLRVTSPETLAIVRRVFHATNLRLVEALQEVDARATSIVAGVFEAEFIDRDALGLPIGNAVDFWTEASLFSAAGYDAFVFGPGDISQAHSADEWIALAQLQRYAEIITRLIADRLA